MKNTFTLDLHGMHTKEAIGVSGCGAARVEKLPCSHV